MRIFNTDWVGDVVDVLVTHGARRATKYISPKEVTSACLPMYEGKVRDGRDTRLTVVVKIGAPNHEEREFIKACKKAGEPFPVQKIQLKYPPERKTRK